MNENKKGQPEVKDINWTIMVNETRPWQRLTLKERIDIVKELEPVIMQNSGSINDLPSISVVASKKELEEIYPRKTQEHVID